MAAMILTAPATDDPAELRRHIAFLHEQLAILQRDLAFYTATELDAQARARAEWAAKFEAEHTRHLEVLKLSVKQSSRYELLRRYKVKIPGLRIVDSGERLDRALDRVDGTSDFPQGAATATPRRGKG